MKKKLIIEKCSECKHIIKGHKWRHSGDVTYYVRTWKCSLENKEIDTDEILYKFETFDKDFMKRIPYDIPEWCKLEDE